MERPVVIIRVAPGAAIACMFKDKETYDDFQANAVETQTEQPVIYHVKVMRVFIGNTILKPKE